MHVHVLAVRNKLCIVSWRSCCCCVAFSTVDLSHDCFLCCLVLSCGMSECVSPALLPFLACCLSLPKHQTKSDYAHYLSSLWVFRCVQFAHLFRVGTGFLPCSFVSVAACVYVWVTCYVLIFIARVCCWRSCEPDIKPDPLQTLCDQPPSMCHMDKNIAEKRKREKRNKR